MPAELSALALEGSGVGLTGTKSIVGGIAICDDANPGAVFKRKHHPLDARLLHSKSRQKSKGLKLIWQVQ